MCIIMNLWLYIFVQMSLGIFVGNTLSFWLKVISGGILLILQNQVFSCFATCFGEVAFVFSTCAFQISDRQD